MTAAVGKAMRLKRVIDPKGVSVICALDHGMTSPSFLEPLSDIAARTAEAVRGGANVIMMSKGMIRIAEPAFSPTTIASAVDRLCIVTSRLATNLSLEPTPNSPQ